MKEFKMKRIELKQIITQIIKEELSSNEPIVKATELFKNGYSLRQTLKRTDKIWKKEWGRALTKIEIAEITKLWKDKYKGDFMDEW